MQFVVYRRRNQCVDRQIQIAVLLRKLDQSALNRLNRFDSFHAATVVAGFHYTVATRQMHAAAGWAPLPDVFQSDIDTACSENAGNQKM